jgi:hypothetical protein
VSIEANAAIGVVPAFIGVGISVALEVPVVAEVCGMGSPTKLYENVEVKVGGVGLKFSTRGLAAGLAHLARLKYAGEGVLHAGASVHSGAHLLDYALAYSSLLGSTIYVGEALVPLSELSGLWSVVVKLRSRASDPSRVLIDLLSQIRPDFVADSLLSDSALEVLEVLGRIQLKHVQPSVRRALEDARRKIGFLAAVLDYYGEKLLLITEDYESSELLSAKLARVGESIEGQLVVPH